MDSWEDLTKQDEKRRRLLCEAYATHDERDRLTIEEFDKMLETCVLKD